MDTNNNNNAFLNKTFSVKPDAIGSPVEFRSLNPIFTYVHAVPSSSSEKVNNYYHGNSTP